VLPLTYQPAPAKAPAGQPGAAGWPAFAARRSRLTGVRCPAQPPGVSICCG